MKLKPIKCADSECPRIIGFSCTDENPPPILCNPCASEYAQVLDLLQKNEYPDNSEKIIHYVPGQNAIPIMRKGIVFQRNLTNLRWNTFLKDLE